MCQWTQNVYDVTDNSEKLVVVFKELDIGQSEVLNELNAQLLVSVLPLG